ncbi:carbohydrate ABC transporter permease [Jonesiaceae bacterium BS-20]|uniref:Carbohydrate ABC transporter permease n=1 Tax=Jonesiaceae bacterium BS-20 TaxID=3120821 RepID=A0AAU7DWB7_9MICO
MTSALVDEAASTSGQVTRVSKKNRLLNGKPYRPSVDGIPTKSMMPSTTARTLTLVVLVGVLIYFLAPIFWVLVSASKSNSELISSSGFWFADIQYAQNYAKLLEWTQGDFWRWVINSVFYSTTAGVVGTLISVAAGYSLAKFRFRERGATLGFIMAGMLMPVALLTIPLYIVFNSVGLTNTIWAVLIPSCVSPFGVFLGRVYAESSVPTELLEAARLDGASEARIFFTVVLRLLAPAMVTIFLFIFVGTWNNFLLPLMMLNDSSLKPVTLGLYGMMSYFNPQKGAVMLGALLSVLPLIILFLGLQRYWQSGLAAGAVKS